MSVYFIYNGVLYLRKQGHGQEVVDVSRISMSKLAGQLKTKAVIKLMNTET
jgi:hypothetical protein